MIRCKICGRVLVPDPKENRHGKTYIYYVCSSRMERGKCNNKKYLSEKNVIAFYLAELKKLQFSQDTLKYFEESMLDYLRSQVSTVKGERSIYEAKRTRLNNMIDETADMRAAKEITSDKFMQLNAKYQKQLDEVEVKLQSLRKVNLDMSIEVMDWIDNLTDVSNFVEYAYHNADVQDFSELIRKLTSNLFYDGENLSHDWAEVISTLLKIEGISDWYSHVLETRNLWEQFFKAFELVRKIA